ncbi:uncharacterized protein C12orf60 homolog isoform X2 [Felis catus]|uniref:uncharacterized protein C12orf60 homolog isoform X2 n=1 Tax=Felis catus TaxID=9685 RepID=UPI001D1A0E35|nr:uncharacterized protein C12orf60 homolog isoform X2 [Felis catus]
MSSLSSFPAICGLSDTPPPFPLKKFSRFGFGPNFESQKALTRYYHEVKTTVSDFEFRRSSTTLLFRYLDSQCLYWC